MTFSLVYVTCANREEALGIGHALVGERLAACANVHEPVTSIYRWQGEIEHSKEAALILKTRAELLPKITARVKALHSYQNPCVIALPITDGSPEFLAWIKDETL